MHLCTCDQPGQAALVPGQRSRILAVPEKFADGDVELWLERFALCAAANSWNADAKVKILPTYLKGRAYAVYRRLTAEQKASYDVLATALKETFLPGTGERRRLARRQFSERSLRDGEALEVYARELEDLLDRAMPGLAEDLREQQIIDRFVEGLPRTPGISWIYTRKQHSKLQLLELVN